MADKGSIISALSKHKYIMQSISIDEFGYNVAEVLPITENTLETDTVIIGYSISVCSDEVVAETHYITLNDLLGADTVVIGSERPIEVIH